MEKAENVSEWPLEMKLSYIEFCKGLYSPDSIIYGIPRAIIRYIGYFAVREFIKEYMPPTISFYSSEDLVCVYMVLPPVPPEHDSFDLISPITPISYEQDDDEDAFRTESLRFIIWTTEFVLHHWVAETDLSVVQHLTRNRIDELEKLGFRNLGINRRFIRLMPSSFTLSVFNATLCRWDTTLFIVRKVKRADVPLFCILEGLPVPFELTSTIDSTLNLLNPDGYSIPECRVYDRREDFENK